MDKWYLMRAAHISDNGMASISRIARHETDVTVYVLRGVNSDSKKYAISHGTTPLHQVGEKVTWVIDTGNGHRSPRYNDEVLEIQNIIIIHKSAMGSSTCVSPENVFGTSGQRSTYVFK